MSRSSLPAENLVAGLPASYSDAQEAKETVKLLLLLLRHCANRVYTTLQ